MYILTCVCMYVCNVCNVYVCIYVFVWFVALPLTPRPKLTERTLIQLIAQNNDFLQKLIQNINLEIQHKKPTWIKQTGGGNKKWTTFTCYSPRIRKITNLFEHTNIGIAFKSTITLQQLTKPKLATNSQEQDKSDVCKLTCNTCKMPYIGQTKRSLKLRYQEHIR